MPSKPKMFSYRQVEEAVRSLHDVPPERLATFRARVRNFQKLNLILSSPGKGQRISYSIFDAVQWALCFEFAELGLGPELTAWLLLKVLFLFLAAFNPEGQDGDWIFWLRGDLFSRYLARAGLYTELECGVKPASRVAEAAFAPDKPGRVLMVNFSKLKRDLGKALDFEWGHDRDALQSAFLEWIDLNIPSLLKGFEVEPDDDVD
ncbi:hypothetical protein [Methylocella sp.]|uniref:hypothetical protein n=1 Tax=Methylocella sp. TaxID=1978226 RepID=UPI003C1C6A8C